MGAHADYPADRRNEGCYALRLAKDLMRRGVARELGRIGPDVVALVGVIALTEDDAWYRGPVTYYTQQLLDRLGWSGWERLDRARRAAVEAGWLEYRQQGTREPGLYWTVTPEDAPASGLSPPSGIIPRQSPGQFRDDRRDNHGYPSTLDPIPDPSPSPDQRTTDPPGTGYWFLVRGSAREDWQLPASKLAEWRESYPDLDVAAELAAARQWLRDNPRHRKTAGGMVRFLGGWLSRAQNTPRLRQGRGAVAAAPHRGQARDLSGGGGQRYDPDCQGGDF